MTTLVIDRDTLPEPLFSLIDAKRVAVSREADNVVLTPVAEADDGPDSDYIDPADYPRHHGVFERPAGRGGKNTCLRQDTD